MRPGPWRAAQGAVLAVTVLLLGGLVLRPEPSLDLLWNLAVPVLPAVFLLSPTLWRNVCPLGTLTALPRWSGHRRLSPEWSRRSAAGGIVLLALLVPARRVLFNEHGLAAAALVGAVALLALALGLLFDRKAGFCNSLCPILPVERLYGQKPVLHPPNVHCASCTLCTARACLDLAGERGALAAVGRRGREESAWLGTSFGAFAAAFPGFVVGYYRTEDGVLSTAGSVYAEVLTWAVASLLVVGLAAWVFRVRAAVALPTLGAAAIALYYWFVAPVVAAAWGLGSPGVATIRVTALGLVLVWTWRVLRPARARAGAGSVGPVSAAAEGPD